MNKDIDDCFNIILNEIMPYADYKEIHRDKFVNSLELIDMAEYSRKNCDMGCLFLFRAKIQEAQFQTYICDICGQYMNFELYVNNITCDCMPPLVDNWDDNNDWDNWDDISQEFNNDNGWM